MTQFQYIIKDPEGIHARPAGLLVKEAKNYADTELTITKGSQTVKASQLMKLMSLGAKQGDEITVTAEGGNEEAAITGMKKFLENYL